MPLETIFGKSSGSVLLRFSKEGDALVYITGELKERKIILMKGNGKHIHLGKALDMARGKVDEWNKDKMFVLADALFFMNLSRSNIRTQAAIEFGAGFFLGYLFHRLKINTEATYEVVERDLTATELDAVLNDKEDA